MTQEAEFEDFLRAIAGRLARAFVATYGVDRGEEAFAEAVGYAWEHRERIKSMANPAGFLFRVGQSRSRRRRRPPVFPPVTEADPPWIEPRLPQLLSELSERQRACAVLVHGYGWSHREVAELLDIAPTTVQNHVDRALGHLRARMEVTHDAR